MANPISGVNGGQPVYQPQPVAHAKSKTTSGFEKPKGDSVTISEQGQQAANTYTPYSPVEEANETSTQKAKEAIMGEK